jgi:hypothetical protein
MLEMQEKLNAEKKEKAEKSAKIKEETEYLVWEPKGFKEKAKSFYHNTCEIMFVLLVAGLSIIHSSAVGAGFFVLSLPLLFTMTMSQKRRYYWGLIWASLIQLAVFVILAIKFKVIKDIVKETSDRKVFLNQVRFYECFGFDLIYNEDYLIEDVPPSGVYTTEVEGPKSFFAEFVVTFMTLQVLYFFNK